MDKERQEIIDAGEEAIKSLKEALNELHSAKNWGIYDIFGGGFISTMIKHSKMDDAKNKINQAKVSIKRFEDELDDVDEFKNINLDTDDFLGFADYFFDGFIADMYMQKRINDALDSLRNTIKQIEEILDRI